MNSSDVSTDKLVEDLKMVMHDAEALLKATSAQTGERIQEVRARAEESLRQARARLSEVEREARVLAGGRDGGRSRPGARAIDRSALSRPGTHAKIWKQSRRTRAGAARLAGC